jgi:hypothetical protein
VPDALHQQCEDAVVTILKALNLAGIATNVVPQLLADEGNLAYPYLRVSIEGDPEGLSNFTSGERLWALPVRVEMVDRIAGPAQDKSTAWTTARQAIMDAFPDKRQSSLPAAVHGCEVVPAPVIQKRRGAYQKGVGAVLLRFRAVRAV